MSLVSHFWSTVTGRWPETLTTRSRRIQLSERLAMAIGADAMKPSYTSASTRNGEEELGRGGVSLHDVGATIAQVHGRDEAREERGLR
jgi:hypothetical protein